MASFASTLARADITQFKTGPITVPVTGAEATELIQTIGKAIAPNTNSFSFSSFQCREGLSFNDPINCFGFMTNQQKVFITNAEGNKLGVLIESIDKLVYSNPVNRLHPEMGDLISIKSMICANGECELTYSMGGGAL